MYFLHESVYIYNIHRYHFSKKQNFNSPLPCDITVNPQGQITADYGQLGVWFI